MGRGRQKAKHTKVARDLKYFSPDTNYGALEKELGGPSTDPRLEQDLEKWPEYDSNVDSNADSQYDSDEYVDKYATDDEDDEHEPESKSA